VLILLKEWSSRDHEGMPLCDPEADQAFFEELKTHLNKRIPITELDTSTSTPLNSLQRLRMNLSPSAKRKKVDMISGKRERGGFVLRPRKSKEGVRRKKAGQI
jgi:hypothetical protein